MQINPLIVDLNDFCEELCDEILIAMHFQELNKADIYIANAIAEIKGKKVAQDPFQQVADIYSLPRQEIINNTRDFANKCFKGIFPGDPETIKDLEFDQSEEQLPFLLE